MIEARISEVIGGSIIAIGLLGYSIITLVFRIAPDIVVFCCGDKDILPAVEYLMEMGRKIEIIAFKHSMAWMLRTSGAKITDLTRLRERISRSRGFDDK